MENFVRNSKLNIEEEIKRIELQTVDPLDRIRQIIGVVQVSLTSLKTTVAGYQFRSAEDDFLFFKVGSHFRMDSESPFHCDRFTTMRTNAFLHFVQCI